MANALRELGYRHLRASGLKGKHIEALARDWSDRGLSDRHHEEPHGSPPLVGGPGWGPDEAKLALVKDVHRSAPGGGDQVLGYSLSRTVDWV